MLNITPMVRNLVIVNVAAFVVTDMLGLRTLKLMGILYPFTTEAFMPYQLFTHMFLHGGLGHLFFNMLGLFFFGPLLERFWGSSRFLVFYLICGIGAAGLYAIIGYFQSSMYPMLGASGAIYGVLMGMAMIFPNTQFQLIIPPIPVKAKYLALGLGLISLYSSLSNPDDGIAHLAHLSGMLIAFILIKIWQGQRDRFY